MHDDDHDHSSHQGIRPLGSRPARRLQALVLVLVALVAAGCVASATATPAVTPTSTPGATPTTTATAPASEPGPTATPAPSVAQTDTEWGRIWDAVPPSFPVYTGAKPTETGSGPASAEYDVDGTPAAVTDFYRGALEAAGFATEGVDGPLEDGSLVISSTGEPGGCRVRTTVAPLGGTTVVTILFGAECPFR